MTLARVPLVAAGTDPRLAELERRISAARGRISPLYQALLNSAPIAAGWEALLTAVRTKTSLRADLRELVILRVAVLNRAPYEFEAHVAHAKHAGLADTKIDGTKVGPTASTYDELERAVLAYTDAMTRHVEVPDELFQRLAQCFDVKTLVELTATIGAYNMVSRFLVALRIGMERPDHAA